MTMTRGLRRTLLFLSMVGVGLLVVYLLADPFQRRRPVILDEPSRDDEGRLTLKDGRTQGETQLAFGDVTFDVLPEDAASGDRSLYRVHILSGVPDASGSFLAEKPVITLLDARTGAATGELSADQARFAVGSAVGGSVTIELGRMRVSESELSGHVRGSFRAADGSVAELACEKLRIRGELVEAPGHCTWSRTDLAVSGFDMSWDGTLGRLVFATGARLVLPAAADRAGYDLLAPGGLTLTIPPDAPDPRAAAQAELRGRVAGSSTDGSTLEADTLVFDGPGGTVTLRGQAAFEGAGPGGDRARLTAAQIAVTADEGGKLSRAEAEGDVRLVATGRTSGSAWLAADHLLLEGSRATSPDRVTWGRDELSGAGLELLWDLDAGRLELQRDATLSIDPQTEHVLAGLVITAPGGLSWVLPTEGSAGDAAGGDAAGGAAASGSGELRGPVHGSLPDGTSFDGDRLVFDAPSEGFRLEGGAVVRREAKDLRSELSAARITVLGEGEGLTRAIAEGDVEVLSSSADATPARLSAQQLEARAGALHSEGPVSWSKGGLTVEGTGLDWNEAEGRIELARDAHVAYVDAVRLLDLAADAQGGLTWVAPAGALDPLAEGRGELRGRVTGRTSEGSELEADLVVVDGPSSLVTLRGDARVTIAGADAAAGDAGSGAPITLSSEELLLHSIDVEPRVSAAGDVAWESAGLSGRAVGLEWDGASGRLRLTERVEMRLAGAAGEPTWTVSADGGLDWQAPAEAGAPASAGRTELRGDVIGRNDRGETFRTGHLQLEGSRGEVVLLGPSSFERSAETGSARLVAEESISLRSSDDGSGDQLEALGSARGTLAASDGGPPLQLAASRVSLDSGARTLLLQGGVSIARGQGDERMSLTAADQLLVRVDEHNEPTWFEASGDVRLSRGFEARGDTLWWNVADDEAVLEGAGQMLVSGATMDFERAEFQPRARSFRILRATVRADG